MNLTIDQGNTAVKVGVFDGDALVSSSRFVCLGENQVDQLLASYPIEAAIVSTVGDSSKLAIDYLQQRCRRFVRFSSQTPIPLSNLYETPSTLGVDRLASCVGANFLLPNTNLLVVDMGTCITLDIVTASGSFLGGNISPGMAMRFKALHQYTNALPLVSPEEGVSLFGTNTNDAILSGVVQAIVYELEGYCRHLSLKYPNLSLYLTGGDAFFFEKRLKSSIFVNPNLLLIGLNRILQFNA